MLKKFFILGLVLLFVGAAVFGWLFTKGRKERQEAAFYKLKYTSELEDYPKQYNEWLQTPPAERNPLPWGLDKYGKTKTRTQLRQEQQERLKADLDKLAARWTSVYPFAHILYGENWQEELSKYKKRKELEEHVLTSSIVCTSIGGVFFSWCLLLWTARLLIRVSLYLNKFFVDFFRSRKKTFYKQAAVSNTDKYRKTVEQKSGEQQTRRKKNSKVLINSGWYDFETNHANLHQSAQPQTEPSMKSKPNTDDAAANAEKTAVLIPNEKSIESQKPLKTTTEDGNIKTSRSNRLSEDVPKTVLPDSHEDFQKLEGTLKAQTENLERQIAEFKQMTQIVTQNSLGNSEPLNKTLSDLTQQITTISEYASQQQDRVEKLQNGYDWNIIRNFCLRIIRCLDNLESRLNRLSERGLETGDLEEVRDELVFALESSGLERFEPEINSDYRGQEKNVEVVKGKESSKDPNLKGKIAKVIRAGYRYFIDEENVKVVRTAQVKLFG